MFTPPPYLGLQSRRNCLRLCVVAERRETVWNAGRVGAKREINKAENETIKNDKRQGVVHWIALSKQSQLMNLMKNDQGVDMFDQGQLTLFSIIQANSSNKRQLRSNAGEELVN